MAKNLNHIDSLDTQTLQELYSHYRNDQSDEGLAIFARIRNRLLRLTHKDLHPNEDYYTIDVPQAPDGSFYMINEVVFFGPCEVPACQLEEITYRMDQGRQIERERMQDNGFVKDLGDLGRRARLIQAE